MILTITEFTLWPLPGRIVKILFDTQVGSYGAWYVDWGFRADVLKSGQ